MKWSLNFRVPPTVRAGVLPQYVAESCTRDGDAVEYLGSYNPNAKGNPLTIKLDRFDYWVSKGAKPSDTVRSLVKRSKKAAAATA